MTRILTYVLPCALCATAVVSGQFSEDWDDGMGATRWSAPIVAQEDPGIAFDGGVDYAYDYSGLGIASAPNSVGGTTIGVAMETNTTDQCPDNDPNCTDSDEGEAVGIVPLAGLADMPAGNFRLTADVYLFWNGGSGSTEYGAMGVFSNGNAVPLRFGLDPGDGLAWQWDTDDDASGNQNDLVRFENPPPLETGIGSYATLPCDAIPGVNTGTPADCMFPGNQIVGPANQWTEMVIESVDGMVSFKMNGYTIDTFDNTGGQFSGGTIMIGQSDPFNSVNTPNPDFSNLAIFDNIQLVPEPGSLALLGWGILLLAGVRRR